MDTSIRVLLKNLKDRGMQLEIPLSLQDIKYVRHRV